MTSKTLQKKKKGRRIVLLFSSCLFLSAIVMAQETRFGLQAGLNYSSIVGDLTEGIKFRFSGHGGIVMESEFSRKFTLQAAVLYSSQGFQFSSDLQVLQSGPSDPFDENDFRTNVQLNYLTVPVLGKFALNDRLDVAFGPQFGFLLNQVSKIKNLDQRDDTIPENRLVTNGNFQLDYGLVAGLGVNITDAISVEPRFYVGLRNRLNGLTGNLQNYNVALQVSARYLFL